MENVIPSEKNLENSKYICTTILKESQAQCQDILEKARQQEQQIIEEGQKEGAQKKEVIIKESQTELEALRAKIASTLNLEKRKIVLDGKGKYVEDVFSLIAKQAQDFRQNQEYRNTLKDWIIEGINVVGKNSVSIIYSSSDSFIFDRSFIDYLKDECKRILNGEYELSFLASDFKDIGVIIQSKDEKISYDNRFLARFARVKDKFYIQLLKQE